MYPHLKNERLEIILGFLRSSEAPQESVLCYDIFPHPVILSEGQFLVINMGGTDGD